LKLSGISFLPYAALDGFPQYGADVDLWNAVAKARKITVTFVPEPSVEVMLKKVRNSESTYFSSLR